MEAKTDELVLTQLCEGKITQDEAFDFSILGSSNNHFALCGSSEQIITGELILETNCTKALPYLLAVLEVSQERPITKLIESIDLPKLYKRSNVLERQELALDPVYTAHLAEMPLIAHLINVEWAPRPLAARLQLLCVLTTYGVCKIYTKLPRERVWKNEHTDFAAILQDTLWQPDNASTVKIFQEFQLLVNSIWITAFSWDVSQQKEHIIYLATATGVILAYRFDDSINSEKKLYAQLCTDLERITYLKAFGNGFLLASNVKGFLQLFKVRHESEAENASITALTLLWRQVDRLPCRQILITETDDHYYIVFSKSSHVIVYCLCKKTGDLKTRARTLLDVVKITAIEVINPHEFIIGGFYCELYHLHISHDQSGKMHLDMRAMKTKHINTDLVHLKGIATSNNRNLFILLCESLRNDVRVFTRATKLIVCDLQPCHPLEVLNQPLKQPLDIYLDYAVELYFNISNQIDLSTYRNYLSNSSKSCQDQFSTDGLRTLQLKLLILRSYQFAEKNKIQTFGCLANDVELAYVLQMIKVVSYTLRMKYLATIEHLNEFQYRAALCLVSSCHLLLEQITNESPKEDDEPLVERLGFVIAAQEHLTNVKDDLKLNEKTFEFCDSCTFCKETIDLNTLRCPQNHEVFRCCISQMQVPLENERYCPQCNVVVLDSDAELQQLMAPDEHIRCTFCRFSFTKY